jgi:predicted MarR family transcription regulator
MFEYKNKEKELLKVKYVLNTLDGNGCNVILSIIDDGVYVLKSNNGIAWESLKTANGYDLCGRYGTVREACDKIIKEGGRILTFESSSNDDCKEIKDILLNAL